MIKLKKIKPMFTKLVTTADRYEDDIIVEGVVRPVKGCLKETQKVVAIGGSVREIKVGDMVKVNPKRFAVHAHKENSVRAEVSGSNPIVKYDFDVIEMNDTPYLLLEDRDIEYIVEEWEDIEDTVAAGTEVYNPSKKLITPRKKKVNIIV